MSLPTKHFSLQFLFYSLYVAFALSSLYGFFFYGNNVFYNYFSLFTFVLIIFMIFTVPGELNWFSYFSKFFIYQSHIKKPFTAKESPYFLFINKLYLYPESIKDKKTIIYVFILLFGGYFIQSLCYQYNIQIVSIFLGYLFVSYLLMPQKFRSYLPMLYFKTRLFEKVKVDNRSQT